MAFDDTSSYSRDRAAASDVKFAAGDVVRFVGENRSDITPGGHYVVAYAAQDGGCYVKDAAGDNNWLCKTDFEVVTPPSPSLTAVHAWSASQLDYTKPEADGDHTVHASPPATPGSDPVFRPHHYARYAIEPITFIMANKLPFDIGLIVKYVLRYDAKNGVEDLKKARRFIDIRIETLEREARIEKGEPPATVWSSVL